MVISPEDHKGWLREPSGAMLPIQAVFASVNTLARQKCRLCLQMFKLNVLGLAGHGNRLLNWNRWVEEQHRSPQSQMRARSRPWGDCRASSTWLGSYSWR